MKWLIVSILKLLAVAVIVWGLVFCMIVLFNWGIPYNHLTDIRQLAAFTVSVWVVFGLLFDLAEDL